MNWDKISPEKKAELMELQETRDALERMVEKDISRIELSSIPLFRESRITHIKTIADEKRKDILLKIREAIKEIKGEAK